MIAIFYRWTSTRHGIRTPAPHGGSQMSHQLLINFDPPTHTPTLPPNCNEHAENQHQRSSPACPWRAGPQSRRSFRPRGGACPRDHHRGIPFYTCTVHYIFGMPTRTISTAIARAQHICRPINGPVNLDNANRAALARQAPKQPAAGWDNTNRPACSKSTAVWIRAIRHELRLSRGSWNGLIRI